MNNIASVSTNPVSLTVCSGAAASFSVVAAGTAPLSYMWYKNNINSGINNALFAINNTATNDAGNYKCIISNICGSVTSAIAVLTVNTAPTASIAPSFRSAM